jgi:SAM-dependent methyltransferase
MPTQYDGIGKEYNAMKYLPVGLLEQATVDAHLGDVQGLDVLDLACGAGFYSQKLVNRGARHVLGLDESEEMVQVAAGAIPTTSAGRLHFLVSDCARPFTVGAYDLVLAIWLLNYADSEEVMLTMWRNIFNNLRPGGRCLGITSNPDMLSSVFPSGPRFGLTFTELDLPAEGTIKNRIHAHTSQPIVFDTYTRTRALYEKTAHAAGFCHLRWLPAQAPDDTQLDYTDLLRCPHLAAFEVLRAHESS